MEALFIKMICIIKCSSETYSSRLSDIGQKVCVWVEKSIFDTCNIIF